MRGGFLIFVLTFWLALSACGNSDWYARVWQSDDGLPDNNVTGVAQTADGYLWVSTQGGLAKFNGLQFKRYSLPVVSGSSLEMIRASKVCDGDHLWLALEGGVVMALSPDQSKVYASSNGLWIFRPSSIAQDADGAIWVGYWDGTACRIHGNDVKHYSEKDGLPATGLCWVAADEKKQLWFTQGGRVGVFRNNQFLTLTHLREGSVCIAGRRAGGVWIGAGKDLYQFEEGAALRKVATLNADGEAMEPLVLFEDRAGAVWTGTAAGGLFRFDGTNTARIETSRGEIRSITQDREDNIWVGTSGGGLNRLRPRALQLFGVENGLPFETVRSVCEDTGRSLWVVTQNGLLARSHGDAWSVVGTNEGWTRGQASCIASDSQGNVWIGTTGNGLRRWANEKFTAIHQRDGLVSERIWTVMADSASNVWMASDRPNCVQRMGHGSFEKFNLPGGSHVVRAMAEDTAGLIWLGTEDGRLLKISHNIMSEETPTGLARPTPIRCLLGTPDGSLWIGYGGAGLGWRHDGSFARIGTEQGLPDDFISQIVADGREALWFASNRGIFEVPRSELDQWAGHRADRIRPIVYGKNEGVPSLQANFGYGLSAMRTRDGRICFSMLTGLAVVHPERIDFNQPPPPVSLEGVSVDNEAMAVAPLDLPPRSREVKFEFNALNLAAPENVRFRYQLEGYDQKPIETAERNVIYSRLPAGSYVFNVTACNNSGVWNPAGASLGLIVEPFFWQTWWFRVLLVTAFTGITIALVRYISFRRLRQKLIRLEQDAAVEKDRARIAKDLHDDLGAHLSHIAMLSELAQTDFDQPPQARDHLDQIFHTARLLTRSLDEIVWAVNPRNDSLDRFVAHVCQFAPGFLRAASIRSRLDMPLDLPAIELPANVRHQLYLGLKEALHNIVKHANATEVWLRLSLKDGVLTLIIEDNGKGFDPSAAPANGADGLVNLRLRMSEIGGHLEQTSDPINGTRIIMAAPIEGDRN